MKLLNQWMISFDESKLLHRLLVQDCSEGVIRKLRLERIPLQLFHGSADILV
jgi:hypothetical protein